MKTIIKCVLAVIIALFSIQLSAQNYSIVYQNNAFAFDFYKALANGSAENIFISPFSISSAMAMTYPGARGKTAEEMKAAMGFLKNLKKQNEEYSYLMRDLTEPGSPFIITNTLWTHTGMGYEAEFMEINDTYFGSNFKQVNFMESEKTRNDINTAIEEQTKDKIKELLPPGSIDSDTRLVLTNAVYFKDAWSSPFKKENTKEGKFYTAPQKEVPAMFMHHKGEFNGFENDVVSVLEMPYKNKNFSMMIFLPKISMEKFEAEVLASESYNSWNLLPVPFGKILLPRFKFEQTTDPMAVLKKFGMIAAFGPADFSGISTEIPLFISGIYHKAFVEVNEEGTEAAAATGVVVAKRSAQPPPRNFIADRPFIFIIRDVKSQSILFIGKLVTP
jgi:serpin B